MADSCSVSVGIAAAPGTPSRHPLPTVPAIVAAAGVATAAAAKVPELLRSTRA